MLDKVWHFLASCPSVRRCGAEWHCFQGLGFLPESSSFTNAWDHQKYLMRECCKVAAKGLASLPDLQAQRAAVARVALFLGKVFHKHSGITLGTWTISRPLPLYNYRNDELSQLLSPPVRHGQSSIYILLVTQRLIETAPQYGPCAHGVSARAVGCFGGLSRVLERGGAFWNCCKQYPRISNACVSSLTRTV